MRQCIQNPVRDKDAQQVSLQMQSSQKGFAAAVAAEPEHCILHGASLQPSMSKQEMTLGDGLFKQKKQASLVVRYFTRLDAIPGKVRNCNCDNSHLHQCGKPEESWLPNGGAPGLQGTPPLSGIPADCGIRAIRLWSMFTSAFAWHDSDKILVPRGPQMTVAKSQGPSLQLCMHEEVQSPWLNRPFSILRSLVNACPDRAQALMQVPAWTLLPELLLSPADGVWAVPKRLGCLPDPFMRSGRFLECWRCWTISGQ